MRKKRKLSGADGSEETPSKAARTEAVHPEPENRVPQPSGASPAGYSCAFVWGCNNVGTIRYNTVVLKAVLRIIEILVRIRIRMRGYILLTIGSCHLWIVDLRSLKKHLSSRTRIIRLMTGI